MAVRRPAVGLPEPGQRRRFPFGTVGRADSYPIEVLDDLEESLKHGGYQHMCVHVDNLDAALGELAKRSVDIVGEPFEIEDISRRLAFIRDPWGNMIELSETLPGAGA